MKQTIELIRFIIALPFLIPIIVLFDIFILIGGDRAKELLVRIFERVSDSYE